MELACGGIFSMAVVDADVESNSRHYKVLSKYCYVCMCVWIPMGES